MTFLNILRSSIFQHICIKQAFQGLQSTSNQAPEMLESYRSLNAIELLKCEGLKMRPSLSKQHYGNYFIWFTTWAVIGQDVRDLKSSSGQ